MNNVFYCKGKRLADYLRKNGATLVDTEFSKGRRVFVFKQDEFVDRALEMWEADKKKWLF